MTPDQIFQIANLLALTGWIFLAALPNWKHTGKIVSGGIVALLAVIYLFLLTTHLDAFSKGGFGSLAQISVLFQDRNLLLAGWIHYLAFDLFTGLRMTRDSKGLGLSRWLVLPCLFLTFMFGPVGWLAYAILRMVKTRNFFGEPF
ncbi:MAG: DUF4281 domain-containing protein [Spirochaetia bacterium]|nr:DUF4281 domain-containing protein [Spirochaetia bacterium]